MDQREEFEAKYAKTNQSLGSERQRTHNIQRLIEQEEKFRSTLEQQLEQLQKQKDLVKRDLQASKNELAKEFDMAVLQKEREDASKIMEMEREKNAQILELEEKILKELKDHTVKLVGVETVNALENKLHDEVEGKHSETMKQLKEFDIAQKEQIKGLRLRNEEFTKQATQAKSLRESAKLSVMNGQKRFSTMLVSNNNKVKDMERYRMILKFFVVGNFVKSFKVKKKLLYIYRCLSETLLDVVRENGEVTNEVVNEWFSRAASLVQNTATPMQTIADNLFELKTMLKLCVGEIMKIKDGWKTKSNEFFSHNNAMVEEMSKLGEQTKQHAAVIKRLIAENERREHKVSHNRFRYKQAKQKAPTTPQNVLPTVRRRLKGFRGSSSEPSTRECMHAAARPKTAPVPTVPRALSERVPNNTKQYQTISKNTKLVYAPNLYHTSHWKNYPMPKNNPQLMTLPVDPYATQFESPYSSSRHSQPNSKPVINL